MNETPTSKPKVQLPEPTLRRLPWYLAYVATLRADGVENVSSTSISRHLGVDASQIAKDLSFLNIKGKTRIGYVVADLESRLRDFLGFDTTHRAVVIGAGSLGAALMHDSGLERYGLKIVAAIDTNPALAGKRIADIPVHVAADLPALVADMGISVAIITVPVEYAQAVADSAVDAGIRALWNFTPSRIRAGEGVVISNTSIYSHLAVMFNRLQSSSNA